MTLKHLNKGKLAVFGVVLSSLVLGGWYWNNGSQARLWTEIYAKRSRALQFRFMPALSSFLKRNLSPQYFTTTYGAAGVDHNGNNLATAHGSLLSPDDCVGDFWLTFTYRGTATDPSSMEMRARLSPAFLSKLETGEFRHLVSRTKKEGEVSDTFCGQQWFSSFGENGILNVTLRVAFPNPWIEDIPEYEPGSVDQMYSEIGPTVMRYLKEEAFSDTQDCRIEFVPPFYYSPARDSNLVAGGIAAYFFQRSGPPVYIQINATPSGKNRLQIELKGEGPKGKGRAAFLKPEFLKVDGKALENAPRVYITEAGRQLWVYINGNPRDFDKWSSR